MAGRPVIVFVGCAFICGLLLCSELPLQGAEPAGSGSVSLELSLEDAIALALRNNRGLLNARLRRTVERFSLRVAENEFRPRITVESEFGRKSGSTENGDGGKDGFSLAMALGVPTGGELALGWAVNDEKRGGEPASSRIQLAFIQPLLKGAGREVATADIRAARIAEEINVLAFKSSVIDVISLVVRKYRAYIQARRRLEIRERSLDRAKDLLAVNELLVETGRMAKQDILQTQADIAGRELRLVAAQNSLDEARLALIDVLDIDSAARFGRMDDLMVELDARPPPIDAVGGIYTAFRTRPDYQAAQLKVRNALTRVTKARNARSWDLSLKLSATAKGRLDRAADTLDQKDYEAMLVLSVPIGPAATDPARLRYLEAVSALNISRNDLDELRQRVEIEVHGAHRNVRLSFRRVELARSARRLAEQKAAVEKEKLQLGLSSNFRLVTFENDVVEAQNDELDAIIDYLDALTSLDRVLGITLDRWRIDVEVVERGEDRRSGEDR